MDNTDIQRNENDTSRTLLVSGIDEGMEEFVELFLESKKKGGGRIESFAYDGTNNTALVTFEERKGI